MADEEKQTSADVIEADTEEVSAEDSARSEEAARELEELIADIKKLVWRRRLFKALGIIAAVAGVIGPIWNYVSHNSYRSEISDLLYGEYRTAQTALVEQLRSDSETADASLLLADAVSALDKIAAVEIPNAETERRVEQLVAEEKQFLTDFSRCCEILDTREDITRAEMEWVEAFTADMREGNKLYRFREEIGAVISGKR